MGTINLSLNELKNGKTNYDMIMDNCPDKQAKLIFTLNFLEVSRLNL